MTTKRIPVWVEDNFPDEEFTDDTFTAMAEEVHLDARKEAIASAIKKHYPGGQDHDQSKHGKKGSGPRGVPKTGKRTTFTWITNENYKALRDVDGGWGTFDRSVQVTAHDGYVDIGVFFGPDVAEADAFLALFPKFVKARKNNVALSGDGRIYGVGLQVTLWSDKVNGGVNETGIKRLNKFIEVFRANDPGFTGWVMNGSTTNPMED